MAKKKTKTPRPGQHLYRYARWSGHKPGMEIVRFIEQGLAETDSLAETWEVQELVTTTGERLRRVRCGVGAYYATKRAAYLADLANLRRGKKSIREARAKLLAEYHELEAEIRSVQASLKLEAKIKKK